MKLTTVIVAMATMVGGAWGQNPDAIDNARSVAKTLQQQQASDAKVPAAKPAPGAPAPAVKPAAIPGQKTASAAKAAPAKPAKAAAAKPEASAQHNQLRHVSVVPGTNDIQIEITASGAVNPKVTKLSSPARVLVELPETAVATSQNKIPVDSGGVKAVRVGMDGKTPPTTSVVVDLEKALSYDLVPGAAGKVVLILHTQDAGTAVAKNARAQSAKAPTTASAVTAQTQVAGKSSVASAKPASTTKVAEGKTTTAKPVAAPVVAASNPPAAKPLTKADSKPQAKTVVAAKASPVAVAMPPVTAKPAAAPKPKEEKKWAMTGKRDPFFSPVVQEHGSGCSTGKKCLEIGTINLRGVVKSDSGFIAVVTNNLNKAYFLRENDPVFNGYVVKITGD
jgi:hypothetical protein